MFRMKKIWGMILLTAVLCIGGCGDSSSKKGDLGDVQGERSVTAEQESSAAEKENNSESVISQSAVASLTESSVVPAVPESLLQEPLESEKILSEPEQQLFTEIDHYYIDPVVNSFLSDAGRKVYPSLIDGILHRQKEIRLTDDYDTNLALMMAAKYTPYYFLVKKDTFSSDHRSIRLTYVYDAEQHEEIIEFIDQEYLSILNSCIRPEMNDVEKTLAVYGYFASRISYDYAWLDELNMSDDKYLFPDIEVYDALKSNKGVCHSYTYLCQFALEQLGIECIRVDGLMKEDPDIGHMWLLVKLDGKFYHCDPTWDSHGDGTAGLEYFGMTDAKREESGIDMNTVMVDTAYGDVTADSIRFDDLHDVTAFTMKKDHRMEVQRYGETQIIRSDEL